MAPVRHSLWTCCWSSSHCTFGATCPSVSLCPSIDWSVGYRCRPNHPCYRRRSLLIALSASTLFLLWLFRRAVSRNVMQKKFRTVKKSHPTSRSLMPPPTRTQDTKPGGFVFATFPAHFDRPQDVSLFYRRKTDGPVLSLKPRKESQ